MVSGRVSGIRDTETVVETVLPLSLFVVASAMKGSNQKTRYTCVRSGCSRGPDLLSGLLSEPLSGSGNTGLAPKVI